MSYHSFNQCSWVLDNYTDYLSYSTVYWVLIVAVLLYKMLFIFQWLQTTWVHLPLAHQRTEEHSTHWEVERPDLWSAWKGKRAWLLRWSGSNLGLSWLESLCWIYVHSTYSSEVNMKAITVLVEISTIPWITAIEPRTWNGGKRHALLQKYD